MAIMSSTCLHTQVRNLDAGMDDLAAQIIAEMDVQNKTKIAVTEFSDIEGKATVIGKYTSEELTTKLFQTRKFIVIERSLMEKVLREQKLSLSGIVDEASARKLGKILGVDAVCSGTIADLGKTIKINARLISTETGTLFSVASVEIQKDSRVKILMTKKGGKRDFTLESRGLYSKYAAGLGKGLVLYLPFNGNANDASGNNIHGEVHGAKLTVDRFDNPDSAYAFSGLDGYISIEKKNQLKLTDLSISIWFKSTGSADDLSVLIADEKQYTSTVIWSYRLFGDKDTGRLFFDFTLNNRTGSGRCASSITIHDKCWHHAVITRNSRSNELRLYLDGNFIHSSKYHGTIDNSMNPIYIGLSPYLGGSYPFKGKIDDIRIYNRAISPDEVQALYQEEK